MKVYAKQIYALEDCDGKRVYIHIPIETGNVSVIEQSFSNGSFINGGFVKIPKCGLECEGCCCRKIFRIEPKDVPQYDISNLQEYNDNSLIRDWDYIQSNDIVNYISALDKADESCQCEIQVESDYFYFEDLCSDDVYAVYKTNWQNFNYLNIQLNTEYLYILWISDEEYDQSRKHFCRYVEHAENPTIVRVTSVNVNENAPLSQLYCDGVFVFKRCSNGAIEKYLYVDGIDISDLQEGMFYLVVNSEGLITCYQYLERDIESNSNAIIKIKDGAFKDCDCKKSSILFQTCDGEFTVECFEWNSENTFVVGEYYSVSTDAFQPVLNFDGYLYKNCLQYLCYSDDNPEVVPTYTGLMANKSTNCDSENCTIYFETTLMSCMKDYETTVYVSGDLLNYMRHNDYNSFIWNGKGCLTIPYEPKYVACRIDEIPTIETEDVDRFFHNCDECLDTLDISCYTIHPCDGSREIYIEAAPQGAMCEPVDLSIYENRYISFNYFGEIMCGYVEYNCKVLTENDRRISSNNIIECYYSCAECYDNEEEKQRENENNDKCKQKVGREVEPNYSAHGDYCKKNHKKCCCDDH